MFHAISNIMVSVQVNTHSSTTPSSIHALLQCTSSVFLSCPFHPFSLSFPVIWSGERLDISNMHTAGEVQGRGDTSRTPHPGGRCYSQDNSFARREEDRPHSHTEQELAATTIFLATKEHTLGQSFLTLAGLGDTVDACGGRVLVLLERGSRINGHNDRGGRGSSSGTKGE